MPAIHKCGLCGKVFKKNFDLNKHYRVHTDEKPFPCDICNKSYAYKECLNFHLRKHAERPFQCQTCKKLFSDEYKYGVHVRSHTEDRPHHCLECDARFKQKCALDMHMRFIHTKERPYKCELCDYCCAHDSRLKRHLITHTKEKPYQCEKCLARFGSADYLRKHYLVHTGEKPHVCKECGQAFTLKNTLNIHFKRWHTEVKFRCRCRKFFNTQAELDVHEREIHSTTCDICGMVLSDKYSLLAHAAIHTGNMPFKCEVCHKKFGYKRNMVVHMLNVHGKSGRTGKHQCKKCFRNFCSDSEFYKHNAIHENETQFKCNICHSYFRLRIILKHHLRTHVSAKTERHAQEVLTVKEKGATFKNDDWESSGVRRSSKRQKLLHQSYCEIDSE